MTARPTRGDGSPVSRLTDTERAGSPRPSAPLLRVRHRAPLPAAVARRGERGVVGGLEALPFSVLIFVFGSLLLVNAWGVVDAKFAVTSAAREATRTFAESNDPGAGEVAARRAAEDAIQAYGRSPERLDLDGPTGTLERCGTVSYTATYPVPAIRIPLIGGYGRAFDVTSTHTELVDGLRSGLPGEADCV